MSTAQSPTPTNNAASLPPTPPASQPATPPANQSPLTESHSNRKWLIPLIVLGLLTISTFAGVALIRNRTSLTSDAWSTNQTATAQCTNDGIELTVSFTNTESNNASNCMNVTVRDLQHNKEVDLGQIQPGETRTQTIMLSETQVDNGQVKFDLAWCDGRTGSESRIAQYTALTCDSGFISCSDVKIYNQEGDEIATDEMMVGDTIMLAVTGETTDTAGITQARFSTDGGSTWETTTTKNSDNEFTYEFVVPDETEITIDAQVYNPTLGWQ